MSCGYVFYNFKERTDKSEYRHGGSIPFPHNLEIETRREESKRIIQIFVSDSAMIIKVNVKDGSLSDQIKEEVTGRTGPGGLLSGCRVPSSHQGRRYCQALFHESPIQETGLGGLQNAMQS